MIRKGILTIMIGAGLIALLPAVRCHAADVATVAALQSAVLSANNGGDNTIYLLSGTYALKGVYLRLTSDGITIASKSGNRDDVILDGGYATTEIFQGPWLPYHY